MTDVSAPRTFEVRHVQLARAAFAALAAIMITFSPDHSAGVGLGVFSGFAIATSFVLFAAVWLVYPAGLRWPTLLSAIVTLIAGMAGGVPPLRSTIAFFVIVIAWALLSGLIETVSGARALRDPAKARQRPGQVAPWDGGTPVARMPRGEARDALAIGILTIILGLSLLLVPVGYALPYTIEEVGETYTLTGITIAVGLFGGYAAIVAVYLGIAGFSPRTSTPVTTEAPADAPENLKDHA